MSANSASVPISERARTCLLTFEQCLHGCASLDTQRYSVIQDQTARFTIWTTNMAVFASAKACMDHRIREAPEVQRMLSGILEVLNGQIEECKSPWMRQATASLELPFV
jgi:hypothetical protein